MFWVCPIYVVVKPMKLIVNKKKIIGIWYKIFWIWLRKVLKVTYLEIKANISKHLFRHENLSWANPRNYWGKWAKVYPYPHFLFKFATITWMKSKFLLRNSQNSVVLRKFLMPVYYILHRYFSIKYWNHEIVVT